MASSQVEIALTSPFGCVLRKHNHRERFREAAPRVSSSSSQATFQNNDRSFVVADNIICNNNAATQVDVKNNMDNDGKNMSNVGFTKKDKEDETLSSSNNSPRQSQILDRWAARKAKEMVSTIETEAELLENLGSNNSTSSSSSSSTTLNNRGASSLVQIWEKRLNNPNQTLKCNTTSRTSSLGSSDVGEIFTDESSSPSSSYSDWVAAGDTNIEATCSTPKVADIIKRLKENNYGQEQSNNSNNNNMMMMMGSSCLSSSREQGQHNTSFVLHPVACSPRFRGRRALTDLLMQMERDRRGELKNLAQLAPVSNFPQRGRGRIQSLLRLRSLKRHDEYSTIYEVNRPPKGSSIMHLRERFNIEVKQGSTTQPEIASPIRNTYPHQPENPISPCNPARGEHGSKVTNDYQNAKDKNANDHSSVACDDKPEFETNEEEETHASSSETVCLLEAQDTASQEVTEASTCNNNMVDSADANHHETKDEEANLAEVKEMDDNIGAETEIINYVDETTMNIIEEDRVYASEGNDCDDEQNYVDDEHYYDWISPIARPRSYWEDRRQAWYKEMLDTDPSDKREICQLLERRTVSTFLSSDLRERMDKLMEYHVGTQTQFMSSQEDDEDIGGRMGQLMSFLQQHIQRHAGHHNLEEEEEADEKQEVQEEEDEEEDTLSNGGGYNETISEDGNQSSSSSSTQILNSSSPNMTSWSYRDNEASDDSDSRVDESATSSTQPSRSQSFYQDSRQSSSSINPHSMEIDLIYDMRGQMEQLYREMAQLRNSLKSCIDMQMMLQKSMKREVNTALREKKKKSNDKKAQKKGNCCICYDKKVDSLLYRCGHMCTCMKCANELQWNSGKCPICRAPIADVVRVYVDA